MAYADLLEKEGIVSEFLAVLRPRRRITSWTHLGGFVYQASFDYGYISSFEVNGDALTSIASGTPNAGEYVFDYSAQTITARSANSDNLNTAFSVAFYEIYAGTSDAHYYRDPMDTTTTQVYFDPLIVSSPQMKASSSDTFFGFLPSQSSRIQLSNAEHVFEKHIYDSSFNIAEIDIYHWLESLEDGNVKHIFSGLMSNVSTDENQVTIELFDKLDAFNNEWRNEDDSFFDTANFPNVDSQFIGRPIRYVYGVVDGFIPVNIDYQNTSPTTSDNRDWVVIGEQSNLANISTTAGGGVHTNTRTFVTDTTGFRIGDAIWKDATAGAASDRYGYVTALGANYIDHTTFSLASADTDVIKRGFVGNVIIHQNEVKYKAMYGRDFTTTTFAGGTAGFSFTTNLEANLGMSTLNPSDRVFCRVYGKINDVTLSGNPLGTNDTESGNLTHPVVILCDILKKFGISESELDVSEFVSQEASLTDAIGIAIPQESFSTFPSYKEIFISILKTALLSLFRDGDNLWTIRHLDPLSTASKTLDDSDILGSSYTYNFDYKDVYSDIIVEYAAREQAEEVGLDQQTISQAFASSDTAKYVHKVYRQKTFDSLHFKSADAETLADRLSFIFGDRQGELKISGKNKIFDSLLVDTMEIDRTRLPGYEYDADTTRSRNFAVTDIERSLRRVNLTLNDQKGINENSGSW